MTPDETIWNAFRRWGYLQAELDLFGRLKPMSHPDLEQTGPSAEAARAVYCGSIGVEFLHIPFADRVAWIAERMEGPAPLPDQRRILDRLISAETFERTLQTRYVGSKRYSLEGNTSLVPLLDAMLESGSGIGIRSALLASSHRGRLTLVHHIIGRSASDIFAKFEDVDPRSVLGSGDVKYHLGATGWFTGSNGQRIRMHLASNPSHLEAIYPVALGRVRAKQDRYESTAPRRAVLPVVLHGDAAFAGQGIAAETLNMASLTGYTVEGTVHVIVNNLIGFTTDPDAYQSSRYASDVARRLPIPIFHVNGEDPDAVDRVGRLAIEYRQAFASDVIIDLIGYRRHGHSEVDDPTITQPILYRQIEKHPLLWQSYAKTIGVGEAEALALVESYREVLDGQQAIAKSATKATKLFELPDYWTSYTGGPWRAEIEVDTGLDADRIERLAAVIGSWRDGFHIHPKVKRVLEQRREMGLGKRAIDWGMGEALAFGSLLVDGNPVRLSGQDCRRGTFNHRQSVLIDIEDESEYTPLEHLAEGQARLSIHDSPLSEASVLGFEYGYSRDYPEALVLWEAQFGDFVNGAQVIIDQFVSATEDKWHLLSGLVMLLPHGYEGQGPEHSSARLERFLTLAAEDNIQVCQPTTASQYFHLLRRQAMRRWRKPLVVMTPKSLLRHPGAASPLSEFTIGRFRTVFEDAAVVDAERIILCTGKVFFDLDAERVKRGTTRTALIRLEQLYPFPETVLAEAIARHPNAREVVWVQEEPGNMGSLAFVAPRLGRVAGGRPVRTIKRSASASPATSSPKAHSLEQAALLAHAFLDVSAGARAAAR
ncbi:MAG: 2-oxoglutarate dehydrogenase E1 component [Candidatus Eisenbacteria bacterium]|nr:2-oxoglutarate dehydrogenase E1 component [Candidatus Eisenbacteria bacterium]